MAAEKTVANTLAKAKFWLRHQNTNLNERQRKVLNRLLDAGRNGFEGGVNTRKYMSLTRTSRATNFPNWSRKAALFRRTKAEGVAVMRLFGESPRYLL